jgi:Holliday junction resolvasome RuvABC endonuclease subunit
MGLSFHYKGEIAETERLPELIEEVKEIVSVYQWKYYLLETAFPNNRLTVEKEYTPILSMVSVLPLREAKQCLSPFYRTGK